MADAEHISVLLGEVLEGLALRPGLVVLDGTLGRGGHAAAMAERIAPNGRLIGLDRDEATLSTTRPRFDDCPVPVSLFLACYSQIGEVLEELELPAVDRILLDIGVSSMQIDQPGRGFSFRFDGPLDMRMAQQGEEETAAQLIARLPEEELANLIYRYGEERFSRRIAKRIVESRRIQPIETTGQLASIVRDAVPGRSKIDKATRTFQALRIAVNDELGELERALETMPELLNPGGRLAIISFHSLEDRLVKQAFRDWASDPSYRLVTRRPVVAGEDEQAVNSRSRSAKLRILERCEVVN